MCYISGRTKGEVDEVVTELVSSGIHECMT